ncbi:MAG TPA: gamma-glutamyl-gamma-aminobutyrate hydrolase family protein [Acidimicrobiales bacterium]|nr:gamma-glutamyl-gamma-aminobutyrate hydrolase family protein [Acidimicrobiales bacterium]
MAPVIGITSPPAQRQSPVLGVERALTTLDRAYVEAVAGAGGASVVLAVQDPHHAAAVVARIDALVLSGGGDVAPERYGAERHPEVAGVHEGRDAWELALIAEARARRLPILAICRGLQILNVALGGTLIQHLPDHEAAGGDPHLVPSRFDTDAHHVTVVPGTRLAKVLDQERVDVNTLHHQAVDRIADELVVAAVDQHGIIEAAELGTEAILGVQWHPELIVHATPHDRLFAWVVEEATAREER